MMNGNVNGPFDKLAHMFHNVFRRFMIAVRSDN